MTDPTPRELEIKISDLDRRIDIRLCAMDDARILQAKEYERRLDSLNHEQSRLADDRNRFLARDMFEEYRREMTKWQADMNSFKDMHRGSDQGISLSWGIVLVVFSFLMSLAVYLK